MKSKNQQQFLLSFFEGNCHWYEEKKVNGFWLIKQFNGDNQDWQVAVFTEESYKNYKEAGKQQNKLFNS
jgi:hypothetical protein